MSQCRIIAQPKGSAGSVDLCNFEVVKDLNLRRRAMSKFFMHGKQNALQDVSVVDYGTESTTDTLFSLLIPDESSV